MIRLAYNRQGDMGVNVNVRYEGTKRFFEADLGRVHHLREVNVLGRETF
jgi:hypothetical protein